MKRKILFLFSCMVLSTSSLVASQKQIKLVDNISKEYQIIDTRHPHQYIGWKNENGVSGHIAGAMDFPKEWFLYEKNKKNIDIELNRRGLNKDKKTIIYTDDEINEQTFTAYKNAGFKNLYALKGGINIYAKNGGKLERLPKYSRYVSPKWVEELIDGKNPEGYNGQDYVIIEAYFPKNFDVYKKAHIPGAISANLDEITEIVGPYNISDYEGIPLEVQQTFWGIPKFKDLKLEVEKLGITEDTLVIIYSPEKETIGANRLVFVLDFFGIKDVRLINGGKKLWELEGRELQSGVITPKRSHISFTKPQNSSIKITREEELKLIDDENAVIASVRSWPEYLGEISGYTYINVIGDIKNSRFAYAGSNPYAMEDFRNIDNTMFNYKIIEQRWKKWGIIPSKKISFHCGTGWRAAETYYIAQALGWENIGVYVGGWYEWSKYPNSPTKKPGLPKDAPEIKPVQFHY